MTGFALLGALVIAAIVWKGAHFAYCTLPFCQYQAREADDGFYVQAVGDSEKEGTE